MANTSGYTPWWEQTAVPHGDHLYTSNPSAAVKPVTTTCILVDCAQCGQKHSEPVELGIQAAWEAILARGWVVYHKDFYCASCWAERCHEGT